MDKQSEDQDKVRRLRLPSGKQIEVVVFGATGRRAAAEPEAEAVCARVEATGALEEAKRSALAIVAEAKAELPELPGPQREALELVADGVVERYA